MMQSQQTLGYRPVTLISKQRFSSLYLGQEKGSSSSREIMIKLFDGLPLRKPQEQELFLAEVASIQVLKHPAILPYRSMGMEHSCPYVINSYYADGSLRLELNQRRLSLERSQAIVQQVGAALTFAHERGVVHGNLKPENIMLTPEQSYGVMDFTLPLLRNKVYEPGYEPDVWSAAYMAPELFEGKESSALSDQYALGCLTFELLTGSVPFPALDFATSRDLHRLEEPSALSSFGVSLPASVEYAVHKALAKVPSNRFATIEEFVLALTRPHTTQVEEMFEVMSSPLLQQQINPQRVVSQALEEKRAPAPLPMNDGESQDFAAAETLPLRSIMPQTTDATSIDLLFADLSAQQEESGQQQIMEEAELETLPPASPPLGKQEKRTVGRVSIIAVLIGVIILTAIITPFGLLQRSRLPTVPRVTMPTSVVQRVTSTPYGQQKTALAVVRQRASPVVGQQITPVVGQQATPVVEQQITPTSGNPSGNGSLNATPSPIATPTPAPIATVVPTATPIVTSDACVGGNGVYIYEDINYSGACSKFTSDRADFHGTTVGNDTTCSIKVIGSFTATLYVDSNYRGASSTFTTDIPDLSKFTIGIHTLSSLRVKAGT